MLKDGQGSGYVALTDEEVVKFTPMRIVQRGRIDGRMVNFLPMVDQQRGEQACVALSWRKKKRTCHIYKDRPDQCRQLEPGSAECLEHRERMGVR